MRAVAIAIASIMLLAGCLDSEPPVTDDSDVPGAGWGEAVRYALPEDPMPEGAGHDHEDPSQHKFLWNYEFSDRDPLLQNQAQIAGIHAVDMQDGYLFGAVYGANAISINGGLVIWDLRDPDHPVQTGRVNLPGAVGGDRSMEATVDGNFVVMGTEPVDCLGHVNPVPIDVYLFDTSDKSLPVIADVITTGGVNRGNVGGTPTGDLGEHSIAVHRIQDQDYAFIFGDIYRIDFDETSGAQLVDIGSRVPTSHDLYVRDTPWGDVWALAANGDQGLAIYNVTDVDNVERIGEWNLPDRETRAGQGINYYFHTADVAFFEDDEIVVILSSEDWEDHVSPMWVLDGDSLRDHTRGDDPVLLEMIGEWQNPGDHTAVLTSFSLHNPRFGEDGILTISSYHGGLWQLDFRHPEFRTLGEDGSLSRPAEIAYAVYAEGDQTLVQDPVHSTIESQLCGLGLTLDAPTFMDEEVSEDGHIYTADVYMGLYTFKPSASHPVYGTNATA